MALDRPFGSKYCGDEATVVKSVLDCVFSRRLNPKRSSLAQ
jgi:hypothetical protein